MTALVQFICSHLMPIRCKLWLDSVRNNLRKRVSSGVLARGFWAANQTIVVYPHQMGCNYTALAPKQCFVPQATSQ